jgi:oxidase EvaA
MVRPREIGTVAFVTRSVGGVREYLVQARVEPGNLDLLELGPTVQFQPGSYRSLPPFADLVAQTPWPRVLFSTLQSEEGGRFFHEQHRHLIVALPPAADPVLPQNYRWMTARQLRALVRYSNQLNVQARSLLACIGALGMRE